MTDSTQDVRFEGCSEHARSELQVYLGWLSQAGLKDTEYAFVLFAVGRAGLKDPRQLFMVWDRMMAGTVDRKSRSQIRRFFINPSPDVAFDVPAMAGWFNLLESLYAQAQSMQVPHLAHPVFVKVGFADLPA